MKMKFMNLPNPKIKMKKTIKYLIGLSVFATIILWIDPKIISALLELFPPSANEWMGVIKIGLWFVLLWLTLGITFGISMTITFIAGLCLSANPQRNKYKKYIPKKSVFMQRMEEAKEKREHLEK